MERITSRQNPLVARYRALHGGSPGADRSMLLDGEHLVEEALAAGLAFESLAVRAQDTERFAALASRAAAAGARVVVVTPPVLDALSPVRQASGLAALARRPERSLEDALSSQPALILVLAGIQDPGNVGAIVRAAEAFGATAVIAGEGTADPFSWKALRGSMGSAFRLPILNRRPLSEVVDELRAAGICLVATMARGGRPLDACDLRRPAALLLGGEGPGLDDRLARLADLHVSIPMRAPVESLNVAVAAAIVTYAAARQRQAGAADPSPTGS